MGKKKKHRNPVIYSSPEEKNLRQNLKVLFALSALASIIDILLVAVLDDSLDKKAFGAVSGFVLLAVIILKDKRKITWELPYIILMCALYLSLSAFLIFKTSAIFIRCLWFLEITLFLVFAILLLIKKHKK